MMLKSKRILSIIMVMLFAVSIITGCSGSGNTGGSTPVQTTAGTTTGEQVRPKTGFPIVDEPITLRIMARYRIGMGPFEEMITWKTYEQLSNIKIEWDMVETTNYTERRNLALATGDLPDAFLKCGFSTLDLLRYGQEGTFIALNDLLSDYAPNYNKVIQDEDSYPGVRKAITMADGNIYSFIYIFHKDFDSIKYGKYFMNRKWLDAVGKEMPVTLDEYYDVLVAFRDEDPNGNNQKDEIPFYPLNGTQAVELLKGAYGLQNRGFRAASGLIDVDESTQQLRFIPTDPRYRELLEYVKKLYTEKLLDEEMFTASLADLLAKGSRNLVGSFTAAGNTFVGPEFQDDFEGLEHAFKGPYGDQLWVHTSPPAASTGSFVITSANRYPQETMRWVDYFYTEDGMKLFFLGEEGLTYQKNEKGEYEYTDLIHKNPDGLDYNHALNSFVPFAVGDNPALLSPLYFKGNETLPIPTEAARRMRPYGLAEAWTAFNYTPQENEQVVALSNDLSQFVAEKTAEFISGKTPLTEWDNYVNTINRMGLADFMKIQKQAYDRYLSN